MIAKKLLILIIILISACGCSKKNINNLSSNNIKDSDVSKGEEFINLISISNDNNQICFQSTRLGKSDLMLVDRENKRKITFDEESTGVAFGDVYFVDSDNSIIYRKEHILIMKSEIIEGSLKSKTSKTLFTGNNILSAGISTSGNDYYYIADKKDNKYHIYLYDRKLQKSQEISKDYSFLSLFMKPYYVDRYDRLIYRIGTDLYGYDKNSHSSVLLFSGATTFQMYRDKYKELYKKELTEVDLPRYAQGSWFCLQLSEDRNDIYIPVRSKYDKNLAYLFDYNIQNNTLRFVGWLPSDMIFKIINKKILFHMVDDQNASCPLFSKKGVFQCDLRKGDLVQYDVDKNKTEVLRKNVKDFIPFHHQPDSIVVLDYDNNLYEYNIRNHKEKLIIGL